MSRLDSIICRIAPAGKARKIVIGAAVLAAAIAGWAALESGITPAPQLAAWMPSGAQLYIESPDFAGLLHDWNASREKELWLKSSNYEVFSRSRLFGRLGDAQGEFAGAAGQQPDMAFLNQIAGKESALALYDIGKLEFLYITHMPNAQAMQTGLLQSRNGFETRKVGDAVFYVRAPGGDGNNAQSGTPRTVAFAALGDYLLLATREDLLADALALMQRQNQPSLDKDGWFADVTQAASKPGDLRMVLDLSRLVPSPYFRSYWVQQNVTDMGRYRAAISDLYRTHGEFHEERVLLPKSPEDASVEQSDLGRVRALVPEGVGFYRADAAPSLEHVLEAIDTRLLSRRIADYNDRTVAPPDVAPTAPTGTEDDFETRIDAPPATVLPKGAELAGLRNLLEAAQPDTMLIVEKSVSQSDGVFVGYRTGIVLASQKPWSAGDIKAAINQALAPHLTAGTLGVEWKHPRPKQDYFALDGITSLAFAIDGQYCIISDDADLLNAMMQRASGAKPTTGQALVMLAGFNHEAERANFVRATQLMDGAAPNANTDADGSGPGQAPQFFSRNITSLSNTFAAMQREEVSACWKNGALHQTVRYQWKNSAM
ncbi:MAG TPA: hypothetical protein VME23_06030 [Terracidiphilus sp.]|nr:hypothetical protein [Terracidiphilus sp.]